MHNNIIPKHSPQSQAIAQLISGHQKFRAKYFERRNTYQTLVEKGQNPQILVIACCDSRVDPAIVTSCHPGDLFVVRNVANIVPPFESDSRHHGTSAAIEFAVKGLNVSDIIIFGHSHCGGIRALMEKEECDADKTDFIHSWMAVAQPAKAQVLAEYPSADLDQLAHHCEKQSLQISLANLLTFPWVKARITAGALMVHAWYFDLNSGRILRYDESCKNFTDLTRHGLA